MNGGATMTGTIVVDDGFTSPQMIQADRELDARIDYAMKASHDVRAALEEMEQREKDEPPPSDEEVERFRRFVTGHVRTDEWQRVLERIDRGELTWRGLVEDFAAGRTDREVNAAFASLQHAPPASEQELIELGIQAAEPADAGDVVDDAPPPAPEPVMSGRFFAADD